MRIAVLDRDTCKPTDCSVSSNKPCIKYCPGVRTGLETITLGKNGFPYLTPSLCSGCGICVKKCPFNCYKIVNVPEKLDSQITHKYALDGFTLFRMLLPSKGRVLGVIGQNGIGKSTAMNILSGHLKMNLGLFNEDSPDWPEIIDHFKGSILQGYLEGLKEKKLKLIHKPQEITAIPKFVKGTVESLLKKIDTTEKMDYIVSELSLDKILHRDLSVLSGGELQRVSIAAALLREGECYLFDEPSSYLDVSQRLKMAKLIRELSDTEKRVIVIEHDLAILDFLSDQICLLYGVPGAYGIISNVQGVRVGINIYLNGYIKDENMRFREEAIQFHERPPASSLYENSKILFEYGDMETTLGDFHLKIPGGEIHAGEVIGILGPNGSGKTTFINLISGKINPDKGVIDQKDLKLSVKTQYIDYEPEITVYGILQKIKGSPHFDSQYKKRIIQGFKLEDIENRTIKELSGGELQRIAIADCLTNEADVYLIDEPSAFLDVEMRLSMALIIRRSIESIKKAAFIVEHDIITQDFISDSLIVFKGTPGVMGFSSVPQDLRSGMNEFLKMMNITFRRDLSTGRPRVNKINSNLDKYQRKIGEYYYIPTKDED
ncbi:Vitamin B12 import ATP-binding protein BtuD [Candidatus Lokiarchaeum ossiferum]|uniref:Vitamin B12 import ATP-binding protein BtuD n=1 Tax=Candidatus Lokiarchaeum ossiferum TaxID=2951803 RepID=A0ABY6HSE9_9ARCH|nr:Vitamin B12 import ATP-binding protein BtuD [Candidatus Lokiarchaeum sp. B-35]